MKKLLLGFLSIAAISMANIASAADELLAWEKYYQGSGIAPNCSWKATYSSSAGTVFDLWCGNTYVARKGPSIPSAITNVSEGHYVVPRDPNGALDPSGQVSSYNYAIYKKIAVCATPWVKTYSRYDNAVYAKNMALYHKTCGAPCKLSVETGSVLDTYDTVCR